MNVDKCFRLRDWNTVDATEKKKAESFLRYSKDTQIQVNEEKEDGRRIFCLFNSLINVLAMALEIVSRKFMVKKNMVRGDACFILFPE